MGQSANRPKFISPPNGGRSPRTKIIFVGVLRAKISKGQVGEVSPPRGWNRKSATPPKFLNPIFLKTWDRIFFLNFRDQSGPQYLSFKTLIRKSIDQFFSKNEKKTKNSLRGAWPPNLTPEPRVPRNLSRARRGAHDPEKISEIGQRVAEKIEFEKKSLAPLAAKPEVGVVTWPYEMKAMKMFYIVWKYDDPRAGNDDVIRVFRKRVSAHYKCVNEKWRKILLYTHGPDEQKHYYGVVDY